MFCGVGHSNMFVHFQLSFGGSGRFRKVKPCINCRLYTHRWVKGEKLACTRSSSAKMIGIAMCI